MRAPTLPTMMARGGRLISAAIDFVREYHTDLGAPRSGGPPFVSKSRALIAKTVWRRLPRPVPQPSTRTKCPASSKSSTHADPRGPRTIRPVPARYSRPWGWGLVTYGWRCFRTQLNDHRFGENGNRSAPRAGSWHVFPRDVECCIIGHGHTSGIFTFAAAPGHAAPASALPPAAGMEGLASA